MRAVRATIDLMFGNCQISYVVIGLSVRLSARLLTILHKIV